MQHTALLVVVQSACSCLSCCCCRCACAQGGKASGLAQQAAGRKEGGVGRETICCCSGGSRQDGTVQGTSGGPGRQDSHTQATVTCVSHLKQDMQLLLGRACGVGAVCVGVCW